MENQNVFGDLNAGVASLHKYLDRLDPDITVEDAILGPDPSLVGDNVEELLPVYTRERVYWISICGESV